MISRWTQLRTANSERSSFAARFTPTADNHYVIEGPVYLGALYPIASDPNGIRTRVHGLKGHCPGPD